MRKLEENEDGIRMQDDRDILVVDTGSGRNSTVTKRAWHVFENTIQKHLIKGYGDSGEGKLDEPVIIVLNHATLVEDDEELDSLVVPFDLMRHGIKVDLTPHNLGDVRAMYVEDEYMPFK
eukprot:11805589-Ditylum_brightwellii.AAC.2